MQILSNVSLYLHCLVQAFLYQLNSTQMKDILFIFTIISLLSSASCRKECPPDSKIGNKPLTEKSLRFFPYKANPKLVFKDNTGKELVFTSQNGVQSEINKIAVYKNCTEVKFDGQSSYDYFEGETKNIVFFSKAPDFSMSLLLSTNILRPEKELFFDQLTIDVMGVGSIGRGEIVTDVRFTDTHEEKEFNIQFPLTPIGIKNLNGIEFQEVYETDSFDGKQVFYTKEKGIIGFITDDNVFHLDRIE